MSIHKVDQKSIGYRILWYLVKFYHHIFYYRKIEVINQHKVPKEGALVFTPNHQNALMDALAVLFSVKRTLVFLARADIFKKKFFAEILYFLRILPVFRPRDGQGEVKKNLETFKKTTEVLQKNLGLVIFPEGTHTDKQSLLPLKKGFIKIAFQTEEASKYQLGIQLMPMAITYNIYEQCQTVLSMSFADPIPLKPYIESFKEHPAKAFNAIRDKVSESLKSIMIHIEDDEHYENNNFLTKTFAPYFYKGQDQITAGRNFVQKLNELKAQKPEKYVLLQTHTTRFLDKTQKLNQRQKQLFKNYSIFKLFINLLRFLLVAVVIIPASLVQMVNYLIPGIPSRFIKDHQFYSTFRFVLGMLSELVFFFPLYYIFHTFLPQYGLWEFFLVYFFSLLLITWQLNWMRRFFGMIKIFFFSLKDAKGYKTAEKEMMEIENLLVNEV